MTENETQADPVTKVARDLREIEDLSAQVLTQAVHKANDRDMPGGAAMVALAHIANLEAWEHQFEAAEARWTERVDLGLADDRDRPDTDDYDDWEPPLQTLCFWSEEWRREHGYELDRRPTIASEANFIRWCLNWAWENEPKWDDFTEDIRKTRARMENLLYAGIRVERGVPCMYDECKGARLVRHIDNDGERSDWRCPRCRKTWNEDRYWSNVRAANERAQREEIGPETWCSVEYAARDVERSVKTIRTWVNRGHVSTACIILGRRIRFVNLNEVRARHEEAKKRGKRAA